jgi:hypothetical protein
LLLQIEFTDVINCDAFSVAPSIVNDILKCSTGRRHDTQHNAIQHNDTQHNSSDVMLNVIYSECHKLIMLSVVMLNVVMLSIVMLSVVAPTGEP